MRVRVVYRHFRTHSELEVVGLPHRDLPAMLYVKLPTGELRPIAKSLVVTIEGAAAMREPPMPAFLAANDPRFRMFEDLCDHQVKAFADPNKIPLPKRVRIEHYREVPKDPAIADEALNKHGIRTLTEGVAHHLNETWLTLALDGQEGGLKEAIPRAKVVDIVDLGPSQVNAEPMVLASDDMRFFAFAQACDDGKIVRVRFFDAAGKPQVKEGIAVVIDRGASGCLELKTFSDPGHPELDVIPRKRVIDIEILGPAPKVVEADPGDEP